MQELAISEHVSIKGSACNLDELGCDICCNSVPMTESHYPSLVKLTFETRDKSKEHFKTKPFEFLF